MKKLQIISKMTMGIAKVAGRNGLKMRKYSPEILVVSGVFGVVTSTVLACRATLKLETIVDEAKGTLDKIKDTRATMDDEAYSEKDASKDAYITYVQTGVKIAKIYAPAVSIGVLSIGAILCSFKILSKRNVALLAAYKGAEEAFFKYRERVIADVGEEKDKEYKYGTHKETIAVTEVDENGKSKNG